MHGNVWEWTADAYGSYESGAQTDPFNAEAEARTVSFGIGQVRHSGWFGTPA